MAETVLTLVREFNFAPSQWDMNVLKVLLKDYWIPDSLKRSVDVGFLWKIREQDKAVSPDAQYLYYQPNFLKHFDLQHYEFRDTYSQVF